MEHLKNIYYIITYIMMVAVVLLISVFYRQPLASVLLVFLVILPFISIAAGIYGSKRISITVSAPTEHVAEGDSFRLRIRIKNSSAIPLLRCTLRYKYYNRYRQDDKQYLLTLAGESFADNDLFASFTTSIPGMFVFESSELLISDPLHFHTFRKKCVISVTVPIMPVTVPVRDADYEQYEGEPFDDIISETGELTRDIRQLREYIPGDRLKDVHWKASASAGELMVKEYERSTSLMYLILPEITAKDEPEVLRMYYSLGKKMLADNKGFRTALYHTADRTFSFLSVSDAEELDRSMYEIMREDSSDRDVYGEFMIQNPGSFGIIRVCKSGIINS